MKGFVFGVMVAVLALAGGAYLYVSSGAAPVATSDPELPFEHRLANLALHARMDNEAPTTVPIQADETNLMGGAHVYAEHCAVCHGVPDKPATAIAKGMFPDPPKLFSGKGVTDDPAGESYWKVKGGIRLSGMPSFKESLTDAQIWQVAVLVANADKISSTVKAALAAPPTRPLR